MKILVVDDEEKLCSILCEIFQSKGYKAEFRLTSSEAIGYIKTNVVDLIFLDFRLPDSDRMSTLKKIKKINSDISIVLISAYATVPITVEALKCGADDVIEKDFNEDKIIRLVDSIQERRSLLLSNRIMRESLQEKHRIIGDSIVIKNLLDKINKLAKYQSTVLISGETGVGKELVAWNIHFNSQRSNMPYIKLNCAAIPRELIESELFGYEKGSFTGAISKKVGLFEAADGGTLFLDEIGDLPLGDQSKLLRFLDNAEIMRIGSTKPLKVDTRIIAASNKDLDNLCKSDMFRLDLFHRLNVLSIDVPPLRNRMSDIPILVKEFSARYCNENNIQIKSFDRSAINYFKSIDFPGNVRQLKHMVEKVIVYSSSNFVTVNDIEEILLKHEKSLIPNDADESRLMKNLSKQEKELIIKALIQNEYHLSNTACCLGINRSTLYRKMRMYGLREKKGK